MSEIPIGFPRGYSKEARSDLPPLNLLYLAGHLKQRHDVKVVDMILSRQDVNDLLPILEDYSPDIVGFPTVIALWPSTVELLKLVKRHAPSIYTVVGGANATQYPEETLTFPEIDYAIVGIGQRPLMALCDELEQGKKGEHIENCYVQGESYSQYEVIYSKDDDIENFPFPDRTATAFTEYHGNFFPEKPLTTMITSMGCPFHCAFCCFKRPHVQIRSVDSVVNEMEEIQLLGIRSILFEDDLFTFKPNRVKAICNALIEKRINLHWTLKSRIDLIQPWMPDLLKKSGCFNVHFGIESGNDNTLQRMNKGYTVEQVKEAVKFVKSSGLLCTGNFMIAYPGETKEDVYHTIEFTQELNLDVAQFVITMDLPKTQLCEESIRSGRLSKDPWSELTKYPEKMYLAENFSSSDRFSSEELFQFLEDAYTSTRTLYDY